MNKGLFVNRTRDVESDDSLMYESETNQTTIEMPEPVFFILCFVFIVLAVPLALQKVPPNGFYGVRTAKTMEDRAVWYKANRFFGIGMLICSAFSLSFYVFPRLYPGIFPISPFREFAVAILLMPMAILIMISIVEIKKL